MHSLMKESHLIHKPEEKAQTVRPYTIDDTGMRLPTTVREWAIFRAWGCVEELRRAGNSGRAALWLYTIHLSYFAMHVATHLLPFLQVKGLEEWRQRRAGTYRSAGLRSSDFPSGSALSATNAQVQQAATEDTAK